ncbi:MAG: DEAD/DEAH box helicase [Iphinoe sp. HA4291-MV1]|jgi:superfamily II DNA or RNA helicase|nr:DEAD/DEAH box helicase [Iphinoe sp. HA4291-MV1]
MELRDYQEQAVNRLFNATQNTCRQLPTGGGKSFEIYHLVQRKLQTGVSRIAILAPNREIIDTLFSYFKGGEATRAYTGMKPDLDKKVLLATYGTAKKLLPVFEPELILVDEAAHIAANDLGATIKKLNVLTHGFTATPNRLDGKGLKDFFSDLILAPPIRWFIQNKYLSPYFLHAIECPLFKDASTDNLSVQSSIFGTKPEVEKTVKIYFEKCRDEKTLIFCTGVKHAIDLQTEFAKHGLNAAFIQSKTPQKERNEFFQQFKKGEIKVLINIQIFVEGVDVPSVQNVFLCRFTYSTALLLQMLGRVLRRAEGKKEAHIFDLAGNCYYHGSPDADFDWSLLGQSWRLEDNKQTLQVKCECCGNDLIHKKWVTDYIDICCIACHTEIFVSPTLSNTRKAQQYYVGKTFDLAELNDYDPKIVAELTSLILQQKTKGRRKLKLEQKITKILAMAVPDALKKRALLHLGVSKSTIDFYFDNEDDGIEEVS